MKGLSIKDSINLRIHRDDTMIPVKVFGRDYVACNSNRLFGEDPMGGEDILYPSLMHPVKWIQAHKVSLSLNGA